MSGEKQKHQGDISIDTGVAVMPSSLPAKPAVVLGGIILVWWLVQYLFNWALLSLLVFFGLIYYFFWHAVSSAEKRVLIEKITLFTNGFSYLAFCKDTKWPKQPDPDTLTNIEQTKRIVFVRHGESKWNEVFNKGFGPSFIVRLVTAIIGELNVLFTGDSVFVDASLNRDGFQQAKELREFLLKPEADPVVKQVKDAMRSVDPNSILVSSNLRRAIETATVAVSPRLEKGSDKLFILSSLQETSRNIDAQAIAKPNTVPDLHVLKNEVWSGWDPATCYDTSFNKGNKVLSVNGLARMYEFNDFVFSRKEDTIIVAGGHSHYFLAFWRTFLPQNLDHVAKKKKLKNCGVVAFTLEKGRWPNGQVGYRVTPESMAVIYGGFK